MPRAVEREGVIRVLQSVARRGRASPENPARAGGGALFAALLALACLCLPDLAPVALAQANTAPVAVNDTVTVESGTANNVVDVLANDTDADAGTTLTVTEVARPAQGRATISGDGQLVYYAAPLRFAGETEFAYTVSDGTDTATATVTVTVTDAPDFPVLELIGDMAVRAGDPLTFTVSAADADPSSVLEYGAIGLPAGASFDPASRTFTWAPGTGQVGVHTVTFRVRDGTDVVPGVPRQDTEVIEILVNARAEELNVGVELIYCVETTVGESECSPPTDPDFTLSEDHDAFGGLDSTGLAIAVFNDLVVPSGGNVLYSDNFDRTVHIGGSVDRGDFTCSSGTSPDPDCNRRNSGSFAILQGPGQAIRDDPAGHLFWTTYRVTLRPDTIIEGTEHIQISAEYSHVVGGVTFTGTAYSRLEPVLDDDTGVVRFGQTGSTSGSVLEGDTTVLEVRLANGGSRRTASFDLLVPWGFGPGATGVVEPTSGTLRIPAGRSSGLITVRALSDGTPNTRTPVTATIGGVWEDVVGRAVREGRVSVEPGAATLLVRDPGLFPPTATVDDQSFVLNEMITPLTLPTAIVSPVEYALADGDGGLPDGLAFDTGTRVLSGTPTTPGTVRLFYSVSDPATMPVETETLSFVATIRSPTAPVAVDDTVTIDEDESMLIDVLDNDENNNPGVPTLMVSLGELPALNGETAVEDGMIRYTPGPEFAGTEVFDYVISDGTEQDRASVTVTVEVVDDPLAIDPIPDQTVTADVPLTVAVSAFDPDDTVTPVYGLESPPDGVSIDTGTGDITISLGLERVGEPQFTVTATATAGTDTATVMFGVTVVGAGPILSISGVPAAVNGPFTVTFTFDEPVTGFDVMDIDVTNGEASGLTGGGAAYTATVTPGTDGAVTVSLAAGAVTAAGDGADNYAAEAETVADLTAPVASIVAPTHANAPFTVSVTFDEDVTGLDEAEIQVTNGTHSGFSGSGMSYVVTVTATNEGDVAISVAQGVAEDAVGNGSAAASHTVVFDTTPPSVEIAGIPDMVSAPMTGTVTFSEEVTGFDEHDFVLDNGRVESLAGGPVTFTATIVARRDTPLSIDIPAGAATDLAGNPNTAAPQVTADANVPPDLEISAPALVNSAFTATFSFSQPVSGFAEDDIVVTNGEDSDFVTIDEGAVYTRVVTPDAAGGNVVISVAEGAADATDDDNPSRAATLTVVADLTDPVLEITGAVDPGKVSLTFTFDENVTGFDLFDIQTDNGRIGGFSGSGAVYFAVVTPGENGPLNVSVAAAAATDIAGNPNEADSETFTAAGVRENVRIGAPSRVNGPFDVTFEFTGAVTGFEAGDVMVSNGVFSGFSGSGASYSGRVTPAADFEGDLVISVPIDSVAEGNLPEALTVVVDRTPPAVAIRNVPTATNGAFVATFAFSEAVSGFDGSDIGLSNAEASGFSGSGAEYSAVITPLADGVVAIDVAAGVATDVAGNGNTAAAQVTSRADVPLRLWIDAPALVNGPFEVSFRFGEAATGFDAEDDITVTNGSLSGFTGSGASYSATVTPAADGTVDISVAAAAATAAGDGDPSLAAEAETEADLTAPTVSIGGVPDPSSMPFTVMFSFSEPVTGFDISDIRLVNATASDFGGSGAAYSVVVAPTRDGALHVDVPADVATDRAGNGNTAAARSSSVANVPPAVAIDAPAAVNDRPFVVTFTFTEAVEGFDAGDVTTTNGDLSGFRSLGGLLHTATVTPQGAGDVVIAVAQDAATAVSDGMGNAAASVTVVADFTDPTLAITGVPSRVSDPFTAAFTFSEPVFGFGLSDITVMNGRVSNLAGSGAVYRAVVTPWADGALAVSVAAGAAMDAAGNLSEAASASATAVNVPPNVVVHAPALVNGAFQVTFEFNRAVTGFEAGDIGLSNGTASGFGGSGADYSVTVTPLNDGNVDISVPAGAASAGGDASRAGSATVVADLTPPSVAIGGVPTDTTGDFVAAFAFSEPVTGFDSSDVGVSNARVSGFSGSGADYRAVISPLADGAVAIDVAAGVATDAAGNGNTAAAQATSQADIPLPLAINAPALANGPFDVSFEFGQAVTGFDAADVNVTDGSLSGFAGSGARYSGTVTPADDGTVTISVAAGVATAGDGNSNVATEVEVEVDSMSPTVSIDGVPPQSTAPFTVTFAFSEPVTGFEISDIRLVNAVASDFAGSDAEYSVVVSPSRDGALHVDVPADVATDRAGNGNTAATRASSVANVPPSLAIDAPAAVNDRPFGVTFTFTEEVTGFEAGDVTTTNGDLSGFRSLGGLLHTATVTPQGAGDVVISVAQGAATAVSDGQGSAAASVTVVADLTDPTLDITGVPSQVSDPFTAVFTFSEPVFGFGLSDIAVVNGRVSNLSGGGAAWRAVVTPWADGALTVSVPAGAAMDAAGNPSEAASASATAVDVPPNVAVHAPALVNGAFRVRFEFNRAVTGFEAGGIVLSNGTASGFGGSGTDYSVTVTPLDDGNVDISVPAGAASAGGEASRAGSATVVADLTPPSVAIGGVPAETDGDFVAAFAFSEPVTGFAGSDIGLSNAAVSGFSGSGSSYRAVVTPLGDGAVTVGVAAGVATDAAGNGNTAAGQATSQADVPLLLAIDAPAAVGADPFAVTFTFNEAVEGFVAADVTTTNGDLSGFGSLGGLLHTATVTPQGAGDVVISVDQDAATAVSDGQGSAAASVTVVADLTGPTLAITGVPAQVADPFTATFAFSESVTGFDLADITVVNGRVSSPSGSGATYRAVVTPWADGALAISVAAGAAMDAAGNPSEAASASATAEEVPLNVWVDAPALVNGATRVTFEFNRPPVAGFGADDIMVSNGTVSGFGRSGTDYTATVTPLDDGNVDISVPAGAASAEGETSGAGSATMLADLTPPSVAIGGVPAETAGDFLAVFAFSEPVTGFAVSDIALTNGSASGFSGSGMLYRAVITPRAAGTVDIGVGADVATDAAGNGNTATSGPSSLANFPLTILSITAPSRAKGTLSVTVTFSEVVEQRPGQPVVRVTEGGAAREVLGASKTNPTTYVASVTLTADSTLVVTVPAGVVTSTLDREANPAATATFTVTLATELVEEPTLAAALAVHGRALGRHAADAVAARFEPRPGWPGGSATGLAEDGPVAEDLAGLLAGMACREEGVCDSPSAWGLLSSSPFEMSFAAGPDGRTGDLTIWGRGAAGGFEGRLDNGSFFDGDFLSGHVGIDRQMNDRLLLGVAFSGSSTDIDYRNTDDTRGVMEIEQMGLAPYAHWSVRPGLGIWGMAGYSAGELEATEEGTGAQGTTDVDMTMLAAGMRSEFETPGEFDWALKTDGLVVHVESDETDDFRATSTDSWMLRAGLGGRSTWETESGWLTPLIDLGARMDGGDAQKMLGDDTGFGIEVGGGLEYVGDSGMRLMVRGRGLVAHSESSVREWGASASLDFRPRSGRGLAFSIAPGWGDDESDADGLLDADTLPLGGTDDGGPGQDGWLPDRVEVRLGYGVPLRGMPGLLTHSGEISVDDGGASRMRLGSGVTMGSLRPVRLGLYIEEARDSSGSDGRVMLEGGLTF